MKQLESFKLDLSEEQLKVLENNYKEISGSILNNTIKQDESEDERLTRITEELYNKFFDK